MFFKKQINWYRSSFASAEEARQFIPLGRAESITVAGRKICLVHSSKGLFAISDRCPHNGFPLAKGWCTKDGDGIVCPLHRYAFNFENGRAISGSGNILVYKLEDRPNGLYVGFEVTVFRIFD